ncbi:unnamed protein product [Orchesella dallaii]|uniref:Mucin-5AC n=1 Tax=Orchesella dallaii TaxID=48710 RepID=A0ABP1Q145_9HEXA
MSLHPKRPLLLLLLIAATSSNTLGVEAPAELVPTSAENVRFSRLLKNTANVLQFSSISNDAPPIWGIQDSKKEAKAKTNSFGNTNFGRRALDYDETHSFDEPSETKIVANPYPGNEYVYVRPGKLEQHIEGQDSDVAASVTSINNKPPRVPLALLRQKKGKRVNISPLFTEVPQLQESAAKEFVWVDQPSETVIGVNRQGRKQQEVDDDATTNPAFQEEDLYEATTLPEEVPVETTTPKENQKSVVNIVTSAPRQSVSVEASSGGKKIKNPRHRTKSTTSTTPPPTTTQAVTTEAPTTTTTSASTTTSEAPTTTPTVVASSAAADDKENLVADASHRTASSFHGFEDSHAKLQTAESSQPARVNVRPAQNGKEYEYEYIYYYYDDDDDNSTSTEKHAEPSVKAVGQKPDVIKQARTSTTLTPSTSGAASSAGTSTTVTTTTTTSRPQVSLADTDFEYEDDAALEEEELPEIPEIQKSTPVATRTTEAPINKSPTSAEKLSNLNPINQLDRSRGPKILQSSEKIDDADADYKLEAEASQEDEAHVRSRGQPLRQAATSSEEDEQTADAPEEVEVSREPSTSAPASTSGLDISQMSTLAKTHKDSVNVPIVIKQSSLLKAVPVSQLQSQAELTPERPSTSPFTTPSTTTTTTAEIEAASEVAPVRPSSPRLRGNRLRANATPRPAPTTTPAPEQPAEEKPQQSIRRPNLRDSSRRIPSRRPVKESAPEEIPEQQPAASPIIETHARPLPIRPRFPPRTGNHAVTTAAAPTDSVVSETPAPAVTAPANEPNSLEDKRSKDTHVRSKSANDLYAFTRLQQAISSRAPGRVQPKLVAGFVNSAEVTTDAMTSSEVTTVSSLGGQSSESVADDAPSTTSTTTTTTTTEAAQLDKFGRQRGRFGGRTRRPLGSGGAVASSTTTETPSITTRGRYNGGRRRTSTTLAPEEASQQTSSSDSSSSSSAPAESPKPKLPSRNRFSTRNRGSTTETPVTTVEGQKTTEVEKPSTPVVAPSTPAVAPSTPARRRPGAFGGRRRPNQLHQTQTEAPAASQEETSASADASPSTAPATSTAAPAVPAPAAQEQPGRNRFNFGAGGRARPSAGPGNNPVRIRGGGRLRGPTTTTTTEATPEEIQSDVPDQEEHEDAEQSPTIQSENIEPVQNAPVPDTPAPGRGTGGVLGRLKNRPKLVVTTTTLAPEAHLDRKPSRLNGLLNRRKNLGQLTAAAHVKEEVRETTSEVAEEADNHGQEQGDDDHKGVVVQISSSVTESEEVNEAAGEVVEPSSTTPGSILNRLKSQRKPGSLFRKKPDPHGE